MKNIYTCVSKGSCRIVVLDEYSEPSILGNLYSSLWFLQCRLIDMRWLGSITNRGFKSLEILMEKVNWDVWRFVVRKSGG